jgi:small subunit ribosomal protein S36
VRWFGRVPRLVWCITALYFVALVVYSIVVPAYRAPDEPHHVDLTHLLSEELTYPDWDDRRMSAEVLVSNSQVEFSGPRSGHLTAGEAPPRGSRLSFEELGEGRSSGGLNHIAQHPPLYYMLAGGVERAVEVVAGDLSFDVELWLYRLVSVLLVTPVPLIVWWITQQLRLPRAMAVAATLVPLGVPQFLHIGSAVNNDSLLLLTFWLSTALVIRFAQGHLGPRTALLAGAVAGAGLLTKGFALVLPLYGLAGIAVAVLRDPGRRRSGLLAAATYTGTAFVVGGWWWVKNMIRFGELNPSVYYEEVPILDDVEVDLGRFFSAWAQRTTLRFWGSFGWFDVDLPTVLVNVATTLVLVGLIMGCVRRDRVGGAPLGERLLLASPLVLLVATQFGFALWNYALTGQFPGMQGRYWFGALAGMAVVVVAGYSNLLRGHIRALPLVVLVGVLVTNGVALSRLLRFYWGPRDASFSDRLQAVVDWAPLPAGVLGLGLVLGVLVLLAVTGQLGAWAIRGAGWGDGGDDMSETVPHTADPTPLPALPDGSGRSNHSDNSDLRTAPRHVVQEHT